MLLRTFRTTAGLVIYGTVLGAVLAAAFPLMAAADRPPSQVILEAGVGLPQGTLSEDFYETELGLGAVSGLELGFRWRYHINSTWSLAPSFHFMNYKDFKSTAPDGEDFRIKSSSYCYCLEVMWLGRGADKSIRPFLTASAGIYQNRVEGFYKTFDKPFDSSVSTLGGALGAGLRMGLFELSVYYSFNRFDTWAFFDTGQEEHYTWDNLGFRAGWAVPFGED
jgi:hypothetical protein